MSEKKKSFIDSHLFDCFKPSEPHKYENSYDDKQVSEKEKRNDYHKGKYHKSNHKGKTHLTTNCECNHCNCCSSCTIEKVIILNPCSCKLEKYHHDDFRPYRRFKYCEINDD